MNSSHNRTTQRQQAIWLKFMTIGRKCGCHQLQSRSFFYKNFQFPVCARCTGIIIGEFFLAPILLLIGFNKPIFNLICLSIMAIDGLLQYYKIRESTNIRRLITGLLGGYAIMLLSISFLIWVWKLLT